MKTSKPIDGTAVDDGKYGDISSVRTDDDPMRLTSFGDEFTKPLAPEKGVDDALVDDCAEAPKPHIPALKVRMLTSTACSLLLTGAGFATLLTTVFHPQPLPWSLCESTKTGSNNNNSVTSHRANSDQLAQPFHRKAIETK